MAGADLDARHRIGGGTPLHHAAALHHNPAILVALLEAGAALEARNLLGRTPLHSAAAFGDHPAVLAVLIEAGAAVNATDRRGRTPLDLARDPEIIALLQAAGAECGEGSTFSDGRCRPAPDAMAAAG